VQSSSRMAGPTRVFLVEDDAEFAALVRLGARRRDDWTLVGDAGSLEEALAGIERATPDVVLLDLGLPDSDGLGTVERVLARFEPLAVVVLTANDSESLASDALGAGAQDYLDKGDATPSMLARTIRYAADRARHSAAMVRQQEALAAFATHAAHDLSAPLRAIRTFAEMLVDELGPQLSEDHKMYLEQVSSGAARMRTLVDDLMAYARTGHDDAFVSIDLPTLVDELYTEAAAQLTSVRLIADIKEPLEIWGQRTAVQQAFRNLIGNALKFRSRDEPFVRLRAYRDCGRVFVEVIDNGIGIPADAVPSVTQPFARAHGSSEHPGSGLGLALVHRVAQRHGGSVELESELGRGTTVRVDFAAVADTQ
jgi:signal transduction histidine kinase